MKKTSIETYFLMYYCYSTQYSFKWQYMAGAGARAGAEIMDKAGAEKEPEPKINHFGSATLLKWLLRATRKIGFLLIGVLFLKVSKVLLVQ